MPKKLKKTAQEFRVYVPVCLGFTVTAASAEEAMALTLTMVDSGDDIEVSEFKAVNGTRKGKRMSDLALLFGLQSTALEVCTPSGADVILSKRI